jgi:hypothetical protein
MRSPEQCNLPPTGQWFNHAYAYIRENY